MSRRVFIPGQGWGRFEGGAFKLERSQAPAPAGGPSPAPAPGPVPWDNPEKFGTALTQFPPYARCLSVYRNLTLTNGAGDVQVGAWGIAAGEWAFVKWIKCHSIINNFWNDDLLTPIFFKLIWNNELIVNSRAISNREMSFPLEVEKYLIGPGNLAVVTNNQSGANTNACIAWAIWMGLLSKPSK